jgi:two-component system nitrogen regulation response regulator GlnG
MIVVQSDVMRRLLGQLRATAQSDKPTLLIGPSGSGRSFLAKSIHAMSRRDDKPLVEISSMAPSLPENWNVAADRARGGTLLVTDLERLDDYGQRDLKCLLGKLSAWYRPPRLCTTAQPELESLAGSGRFMRSLYDQVAVLRHEIPALSERVDDLPELCRLLLAEHAYAQDCAAPALLPDGLAMLRDYAWPGNVRELSNILLRAMLWSSGRPIGREALTPLLPALPPLTEIRLPIGTSLMQAEQALILATLRACDGNKQLTALKLGITRRTLYHKLARYNHPDEPRYHRR